MLGSLTAQREAGAAFCWCFWTAWAGRILSCNGLMLR